MNSHWNRSRVTKALTDAQEIEFGEAEQRLDAVRLAVTVSSEQAHTAAGQAAALTAVATAAKCFGHADLLLKKDEPLVRPLPIGATLASAARNLGADVLRHDPPGITHWVSIGCNEEMHNFHVRCWWDGWCTGILPRWNARLQGDSSNPLAGVFSGALAVREAFADIRADGRAGTRESIISLWAPWANPMDTNCSPSTIYIPLKLWVIGLGHLGQGYLWSLSFLPEHGDLVVLQDYQKVGEENETTGIITKAADVGKRKTRVAAAWLESLGWPTALIERRFAEDMKPHAEEPAIALSGLDDPKPRIAIAKAGFPYLIDSGVGHGPCDFEILQIRVLQANDTPTWINTAQTRSIDNLLKRRAYQTQAKEHDRCGAFALAEASIAVPFVGAAVGALAITQAIRLATMCETVRIMQMELACPEMTTYGQLRPAPTTNLGGVPVRLSVGQ
jgi:hypothetical protein